MSASIERVHVQTHLRNRRLGKGISVERLAKIIGCSKRYLFLLEAGDRLPSIDLVRRWSKALKSAVRLNLELFERQVAERAIETWRMTERKAP